MASPEISIILPVYNSKPYLSKAIESILMQTFNDFEFIIINDGSTDNSEKIIESYTDPRIKYYKNDQNKGLIYSLNKGIDLAQGKYIARMDADDISVNERLALQKQWLDEHSATAVVACTIQLINEQDETAGYWKLDRETITYKSIKKNLPRENCIAHPSIMARAEILKQYKYKSYQPNVEDYDLWLRLLADGKVIEKLPRPLLLYRTHSKSVTSTQLRGKNFFIKHFHLKRKYIANRMAKGKVNSFDITVFVQMIRDLGMAGLKSIKKQVTK